MKGRVRAAAARAGFDSAVPVARPPAARAAVARPARRRAGRPRRGGFAFSPRHHTRCVDMPTLKRPSEQSTTRPLPVLP